MNVTISVPDYSPETGLVCEFEDEYRIRVEVQEDRSVCIRADKGGLISLARLLLTMSSDLVPDGAHMHLDPYSALEDGSREIIIAKDYSDAR